MARVSVPVVAIGRDTAEPAPVALTAEGGAFTYGGDDIIKLTNAGLVSRTARLETVWADQGALNADRVITLAAGQTRYVRFDGTPFVQANGQVHITPSAATDVTAVVLRAGFADLGTGFHA